MRKPVQTLWSVWCPRSSRTRRSALLTKLAPAVAVAHCVEAGRQLE